jgi:hypothetical protein
MLTLVKDRIDKVQDPVYRAFFWRVYNTFKSVILPVAIPVVIYNLQAYPDEWWVIFTEASLWGNLAYVSLLALLGSTLAGLDKINRMNDGAV